MPLTKRVVEVIGDRGAGPGRYEYGSGVIVCGRTVLTAAHVVADAVTVLVRDPDRKPYSAIKNPDYVGDRDGPRPDLALVEIEDQTLDLPPLGLARVDRDSPKTDPVERCHAIGYPWFGETRSPSAVRDTVDAWGVVPVGSKLKRGLLSLLVEQRPRPLPDEQVSLGESEWSGMSGAPVVAAGLLLGVVSEHAPREGPSAITAVPLTALELDPHDPECCPGVADPAAWWSRLGVKGIEELERLPPGRPKPPYLAVLRENVGALHDRMPQLLDREKELSEIASFATGASGYRWMVSEPFAGKSALLLEAVTTGLPVDADAQVDVVSYFLTRLSSDADSSNFLHATIPQLAYHCDVDPPLDRNRYVFVDLWEQAVERAKRSGRQLLLIVDGLDEDLGRPPILASVASLLPTQVGDAAHVLVASRPLPKLPIDMPGGHPLCETTPVPLDAFKHREKLLKLAKAEIEALVQGDDPLGFDVLGLLAAAAGLLSKADLAQLSGRVDGASAAPARQVELILERSGRSLERVERAGEERYRFAHPWLLEYAREQSPLADLEFRERLHRWAEGWRERGWPEGTPRYLLDTYPGTLSSEPERLAAVVSDAGWVVAAIQAIGVEPLLTDLDSAAAAVPTDAAVAAMLAIVRGQAHNLSASDPLSRPGYVSRQLWLRAAELGEDQPAEEFRARLQSDSDSALLPLWTTRRVAGAVVRELGRHNSWVRVLAPLPDGRVVSNAGWQTLLWDPAEPGAEPRELGDQRMKLDALAALPNGRVVSSGGGGQMLLWDPAEPGAEPLELGRHDGDVHVLAALPDGRIASGGRHLRTRDLRLLVQVLLWDPAEPGAEPLELGGHGGGLAALASLPDGRVVSSGGGQMLLWDPAEPGAEPLDFASHGRRWHALASLPDGSVLSSGGQQLGDPGTAGAEPREFGRNDALTAVAVLPDGHIVSSYGRLRGRVLLWDPAESGAEPLEIGRYDSAVDVLAALPDGHVVSSGGRRMLLWDPGAPGAEPRELGRFDAWGAVVAALPDGRVVTGDGRRVLLWDPADPGVQTPSLRVCRRVPRRMLRNLFRHRLEFFELARHDVEVTALAVLRDRRVVSGDKNGRVLVWDPVKPGGHPLELGQHDRGVRALAALPDGRVVSSSGEQMLLWDPRKSRSQSRELSRAELRAVAALPDGRVVGGDYDNRIRLWDPGKFRGQPRELGRGDHEVLAVAALPNGRVVSGHRDGKVLLWDPSEPGRVALGRVHGWVYAVAALPDGRVVSGDGWGSVLLWEPEEPGALPLKLGRHDSAVKAVAVLPDGRVVSSGQDGRVLLWDVTTHGEIAQLRCEAEALVAGPVARAGAAGLLAIAHAGAGLSFWSVETSSR